MRLWDWWPRLEAGQQGSHTPGPDDLSGSVHVMDMVSVRKGLSH